MGAFVSGTVVGAERVIERFNVTVPERARANAAIAVRELGLTLERKVKLEKLEGQVLHRRSGRLVRSVNTRFRATADTFTSSTGTRLFYGRIWELTGSREHTTTAKNKAALYWPGANHPVRRVHHPAQGPRPFLRPALEEMRPLIRARLMRAMRDL